MASSRESSPGASISPMELTPKSKIRASLAAAGISDSDEESVSGNARKRVASRKPKSDKSNANSQSTALGRTEGSINVGSQTSSDEEEIARPRGRMAARMQAALDGSDDDQLVANNPRERVRRLLKNKPRPESPKVADDGSHADESDMPEVLRRRKTGSSPRQTPVKPIPRQESASPGLFVTPSAGRSATPQADASDPDDFQLDSISKSNKTFQDLVARRRQERHAREAEDRKKKAAKAEERKRQAALIEDDNQVDSEDEGGQRLTQQNRPTRKASKRAIEEMHRETQRLSRNMQLAHKATNKKKITKQSLFAKFGYRQAEETNAVSSDPARPTSSSPPPALQSDIEMQETPPTSPPDEMDPNDKQELAGSSLVTSMAMDVVEEDLPTLEEALKSTLPSRRDKGKGKDVDTELTEASSEKKPAFKQRPIRVRPAKVMTGELELDSDSDLEIVKPKKSARNAKLDAIFKRIPEKQATEPHSMMALRMLAHLRSPGKQNSGRNQKPSITAQDLQISLQLKARQQAHREREERLQALRDRGIIVQTAEEREKEMAEVDDLLAKARREGEEIQAREKAAAKRERKANGELDPLNDSSDDEEWQETNEIPEEEEISGSEDNEHEDSENEESDEGEDEENEEEEATDNPVPNPLFDDEAEEDEESEIDLSIPEDSANLMDAEDEEETLPVHRRSRKSRVTNIIPDDEEEEDLLTKTPRAPRTISLSHPRTDSPVIPTSVLRSATKTFIPGLPITGPAGLGLTQIFQGTMDDSQDIFESSGLGSQTLDVKEHSMDFLRRRAMPELPDFVPTMDDEETQDMVMDSQTQIQASQPVDNETQGIQVSFSQSQIHDFDSLVDNPLSTQISEFPNTQDEGFSMITPIKSRFMDPPSTAGTFKMGSPSTQMINDDIQETPIMKKKGKLRRRARAISVSDEDESLDAAREDNNQNEDFEITADAFDVMRKAAKKKPKVVDEFDKKKSNAKNMVNEQAEESEDEYAGLGGASDDESGGEEDAFVKEMIDDEKKDIDESELAKFYADHERASDEKQIEKLYNDISKGMLRRKRGADYDLSDSDDGGEARQRRKRAAEAKMRKALLADEKIGKIAQNPKKEAFLRAIEDRGSDDEMGFLDDFQEKDDTSDSQSQTQNDESQQSAPNQSGEVMGPPPKRKNSDSNGYVRPPPHLRRTGKKPSNLSEVRESLSSLIEDPHAMVTSTNFESDSDDDLEIEGGPEQETQKNRDPFAIRRTGTSIIDRIQLKRESSSNVAANNERLAFAAPSSQPGHRVVPLLRKATTNSSILSGTSSTGVSIGMSATERMAGGKDEGSGIRRGGGKHSGVNSFVRESERKAVMEKKEKRREQKKFKGVESRRKAVGGLFGKGTFE